MDKKITIGRREFLAGAAAAAASGTFALTIPRQVTAESPEADRGFALYPAAVTEAGRVALDAQQRVPFGWPAAAVPVAADAGPVLKWSGDVPVPATACRLRFTVAVDDREEKRIDALSARSARTLGSFDLRYADVLQPYELRLSPADARTALDEGVRLSLAKGAAPLWFFHRGDGAAQVEPVLTPHLLVEGASPGRPLTEFVRLVHSVASVDAFGWRGGCVLEGIWSLQSFHGEAAARKMLQTHLELFLDAEGRLRYENPRSRPADGAIYGIEGTLPFAAIARLWPDHPTVDQAIAFWRGRRDAQSCIIDGASTTTEGAYTVGFPLAVVARLRQRDDLAALALAQVRRRKERLLVDGHIHQRRSGDGPPGFRNWARGVVWYMLGLVRCLEELAPRDDLDDLKAEWARVAAWAANLQQPGGLWRCYLDDPQTEIDTSGSAGIAAALAVGERLRLNPEPMLDRCRNALGGLIEHLTPDGWMGGAAHSNKGGEALQRSRHRVIHKAGMGLMAQLVGELRRLELD